MRNKKKFLFFNFSTFSTYSYYKIIIIIINKYLIFIFRVAQNRKSLPLPFVVPQCPTNDCFTRGNISVKEIVFLVYWKLLLASKASISLFQSSNGLFCPLAFFTPDPARSSRFANEIHVTSISGSTKLVVAPEFWRVFRFVFFFFFFRFCRWNCEDISEREKPIDWLIAFIRHWYTLKSSENTSDKL